MNDIIANVAQELADHLDDLRGTGEGVTNYNEAEDHQVTDVGDAETDMNEGTVSFFAVVGGQRVLVTVGAV
jgi:hypothetical protein